jgi:hypothetical protein
MNNQYDAIKQMIAEIKQHAKQQEGYNEEVFDKVLKRTMEAIHNRLSPEEIAKISQEDIQRAKDEGILKFGGRKSRKSLRRRKSTRRHKMH